MGLVFVSVEDNDDNFDDDDDDYHDMKGNRCHSAV